MRKFERIKFIKSVYKYLELRKGFYFEDKNESLFDWYSEGQQIFLQIVTDKPMKITPRIKPL